MNRFRVCTRSSIPVSAPITNSNIRTLTINKFSTTYTTIVTLGRYAPSVTTLEPELTSVPQANGNEPSASLSTPSIVLAVVGSVVAFAVVSYALYRIIVLQPRRQPPRWGGDGAFWFFSPGPPGPPGPPGSSGIRRREWERIIIIEERRRARAREREIIIEERRRARAREREIVLVERRRRAAGGEIIVEANVPVVGVVEEIVVVDRPDRERPPRRDRRRREP
jgi:hypothetical protein